MKSVLFESILQESSINEDEILRVTGISASEIEDAFWCTILMGPVSHTKDGYWLFIKDNDGNANYLVAEDIEDYKNKEHKRVPKVGCMFLGLIDLPGPFTKKELCAAYGSNIGGGDWNIIYENYPITCVDKKGRELLYDLVRGPGLENKIKKWSQCFDFRKAKKAAEERVLALRK